MAILEIEWRHDNHWAGQDTPSVHRPLAVVVEYNVKVDRLFHYYHYHYYCKAKDLLLSRSFFALITGSHSYYYCVFVYDDKMFMMVMMVGRQVL